MGPLREAVQLRPQEAKQHLITYFMCIHTFMTWFLPNTKHVEISLNSSMQDWVERKKSI